MQNRVYDRTKALEYARRWALDRNSRYYNFDKIGGDCTNFVSQCIYAGTGIMNYTPNVGWYYRSPYDRTASWSGVKYLYEFLVNNRSSGPFAYEVSADEAEPGDIVQLGRESGGYYHSMIIMNKNPWITVATHTFDALDKPLASYRYDFARFLHIDGARL